MKEIDIIIQLKSINDKMWEAILKARRDMELLMQELTDERDSDRLEKSGKETP